jgi:hypothetical protein
MSMHPTPTTLFFGTLDDLLGWLCHRRSLVIDMVTRPVVGAWTWR